QRSSGPRRQEAPAICKPWADFSGGSVQPRYAATWRRVIQVGLIKVLQAPAASISPWRRTKLCPFFEQAGLRHAASLARVVRDTPVGLLVVKAGRLDGCDNSYQP